MNAPHEIKYFVDGIVQHTTARELTANQILEKAGKAPAQFYLIEIRGKHTESYLDKGTQEIKLHEGLKFITAAIGPTPVSDVSATGYARFVVDLRGLGFAVQELGDGRISFPFNVESGKLTGASVKIGLQVPGDWPLTCPGGIHVSPRVLPMSPPGAPQVHPVGGILESQQFGADFQYWSRPFPNWKATDRTAATYIAFIRRLWDTL